MSSGYRCTKCGTYWDQRPDEVCCTYGEIVHDFDEDTIQRAADELRRWNVNAPGQRPRFYMHHSIGSGDEDKYVGLVRKVAELLNDA